MSVLLQIIQSKLSFEENYKYIIIFWNTGIILKKNGISQFKINTK